MRRYRLLDLFCGEGGIAEGYARAGLELVGVDSSRARLMRYPFYSYCDDALDYLARAGHEYDAIHASPPCTGYTRGTAAIVDRLTRYDRLIPVVRELLDRTGRPYVIENVPDARREMRSPVMLCGRQFGLTTIDDDGTPLTLDRHRLFETNWPLDAPAHEKHDRTLQVAGSYGGARRDKFEARHIRRGGYVPSGDVQRRLLGVSWMSDAGTRLAIPPLYGAYIGARLVDYLRTHNE